MKNLIFKRQGEIRSRWEVFCNKEFFKNFAKFTGKKPVLESLFNKVAGLSLQVYQKETPEQVFFCEFCEILKNTYFFEYLRTAACEGDTPNVFDLIDKLFSLAIRIWLSRPIWVCALFCKCNYSEFYFVKYMPLKLEFWIRYSIAKLP